MFDPMQSLPAVCQDQVSRVGGAGLGAGRLWPGRGHRSCQQQRGLLQIWEASHGSENRSLVDPICYPALNLALAAANFSSREAGLKQHSRNSFGSRHGRDQSSLDIEPPFCDSYGKWIFLRRGKWMFLAEGRGTICASCRAWFFWLSCGT